MAETPTKVVENKENCCRLGLSVDNHRSFLHGEKAKSEGILTSLKQFIGMDLSVSYDEFSSYLCRSCAKKISNVVSKIKELRSLFEESEHVWKYTERIKRGCKN